MRDRMLGAVTVIFLFASFHTVQVRREVYALGREIGGLERALVEQRCEDENQAIELERLGSPAALAEASERTGVRVRAAEAGER